MDTSELIKTIDETNSNIAKNGKRKRKKKPAKRKNQKMSASFILIMILAVIVVIGVAAAAGLYLWNSSFTTINLAEQTSLVLTGYNGKGEAEVAVEAVAGYMDFFDTVEAKLNRTQMLSNADELTVSYTFDEEMAKQLKLKVEAEDTTISVEGLPIAEVITCDQLFDSLSVTFEDISPVITATIENTCTEGFFAEVEFAIIEPKEFYKNGDELIVEATFDEELAMQYLYDIEKGEDGYRKVYEISSEDTYVTDASDITAELLDTMVRNGGTYFDAARAKEYGLRIFSEARLQPMWENKKTFFSWQNPHVISAYFNTVTEEGKAFIETHVNDVKVVYEATLTQPNGISCQAEIVVQYTDLIKHADGSIDLRLENGKIIAASYRNSNIKKLVNDDDDGNYISTRLDI